MTSIRKYRTLHRWAAVVATVVMMTPAVIGLTIASSAAVTTSDIPFACTAATDFLSTGPSGGSTLWSETEPVSAAPSSYVSLATSSLPYNAMAFDPSSGYLYAIEADTNHLLRIDSGGAARDMGPIALLPNPPASGAIYSSGTFDNAGNYWVALGNGSTDAYKISVGTRFATHVAISPWQPGSAPLPWQPADWTFAYGFLWGASGTGIYRFNPANSVVEVWPAPAGFPDAAYLGAWTFANGDLGLQSLTAGASIWRLRITNPDGNTPQNFTRPTFTLIASSAPGIIAGTSSDDGASCIPKFHITTTALPDATVGVPYSFALTASGGSTPANYSWTVLGGALPAGLSLDPATGVISGTPTAPGVSAPQIAAAAAGAFPEQDLKGFGLTVDPAPVSIDTTSLPRATYGGAYSATLTASNGTGPYSFAVTGGALPPGVSLDPGGAISGTPTAAGTSSFTVQVSDSSPSPETSTKTLSIVTDPAGLTATVSGTLTYGGTPTFTVSGYSGFVNGDNASAVTGTLAGCATSAASEGVGSYDGTITGCAGLSSPNYTISYASGPLVVAEAPLSVRVAGAQTYGGTPTFSIAGYSGLVNGDAPEVVAGTLTGCVTTVATGANAGTYTDTIGGCSGLAASNYTISYTDAGFTVSPATLTVNVSGTQVYGGTPSFSVAGYDGFVNGDSGSAVTGSLTGCATSVPQSAAVGAFAGTISGCSGLTSTNYSIGYGDTGFSVTPAPLTISASTGTMTYGGAIPAVGPEYSGFVNGDTESALTTAPTCSTVATPSSNVGAYPTTCSGAASPNYTITYTDGTVSVTPAALTVTASSPSMSYGASVPAITATYAGFVNGDTASGLATPPTCTTIATSLSDVGTYPTACAGAASTNYTFTYQSGVLSVVPATTATTYTGPNPVDSGSSFAPAASVASPAAACAAGRAVALNLDTDPTTGVPGLYPLGSATTDGSGHAVLAAVATTNWQVGTYNLTTSSTGSADCAPSSSTVSLVVQLPVPTFGAEGDAAYAAPGGLAQVNFVVVRLPFTTSYFGSFRFVQNGKWRLDATATNLKRSTLTTGTVSGAGDLYWWNAALNGRHGDWQLAKRGVPYTAPFVTSTAPAAIGALGIQVSYTPTAGQPPLPNSAPIALQRGRIIVR